MFIDVKNMPANYEHLRTRLRIEQARCLNWGEKVGLVEELMNESSKTFQLNYNLILEILLEMQKAFRSSMSIQQKFDPIAAASHPPQQSSSPASERKSFKDRTLAVWKKSGHVVGRIEWMMVKKNGFEKLTESLIHFNNRIESFLDRNTLDEIRRGQAQHNLMLLQVTQQIGDLHGLVAALRLDKSAKKDAVSLSRASTLVADDDQLSLLASLAAFKAHTLELAASKIPASQMEVDINELVEDARPQKSTRQIARLKERSVWIEKREAIHDIDTIPGYKAQLTSFVKELAMILSSNEKPQTFRSPQCLGYCYDQQSNGHALIYDWPAGNDDSNATIISLRDSIVSSVKVPLNLRISLACQLAESILHLHAVNWLHKGFRSDSVLFTTVNGEVTFTDAIISGFEFSRPALPEAITVTHVFPLEQDLYRHPELLDLEPSRSKKSHDIYSLGLVLAEIALWEPIEKITTVEVRRSRLYQVRERMLDSRYGILASISERAGDIFANIVKRCVLGGNAIGVALGADEEKPEVGAAMQQVFYNEVVSQLRSLKV